MIVGTAEGVYTPSMGLQWAAVMTVAYSVSFCLCKLNVLSVLLLTV